MPDRTKLLLLFDIDGTLLQVNGKMNHKILADALAACGVDGTPIFNERFAGRTDRDIFLSLPGVVPELFDDIKKEYSYLMENNLSESDIRVIPGVEKCLQYLKNEGYAMGLITGNCRDAAYTKLNKAGLGHYFASGGFGDLHEDRNYLPQLARTSSSEYFGYAFNPEETFIIGDTPNDIRCARHASSHAIAVSTGIYSHEELAAHNPDLLLSSLEHPENWLTDYINEHQLNSSSGRSD